jgi:predicted short-subunit dehydrogenase-like oxidoreductase (DUF2520 family)
MNLSSAQMASYHAAAAMASNYVVSAIDAAAEALAMAGVPANQAALALVPLAEGALRNVSAHGTTAGLTAICCLPVGLLLGAGLGAIGALIMAGAKPE